MDIEEEEWKGCYGPHKWNAYKSKGSVSHPAKMANGLLEKIFQYLMKKGILKYGDTVLDPMAGIGTTAIGWILMDPDRNRAITVELEEKFVFMQEVNKTLLEDRLKRKVNWTIIKGDARKLSELLKEHGLVSVLSPPYANRFDKGNEQQRKREGTMQNEMNVGGYSEDPQNIGNCPDRPVVLTSPPFVDAIKGGEGPNVPEFFVWAKEKAGCWPIPNEKMRELSNEWQKIQRGKSGYSPDPANIGNCPDKPVLVMSPPYGLGKGVGHGGGAESTEKLYREKSLHRDYSDDENNIGNLPDREPVVVTSPVYPTQSGGTNVTSKKGPLSDPALLKRQAAGNLAAKGYGVSEGNLGTLKDEPVVVLSPPYGNPRPGDNAEARDVKRGFKPMKGSFRSNYPEGEGQIGNLDEEKAVKGKETYLQAMLSVYQECAKVCRAIVTVTKNPTKNKQLRRLDIDTKALLEKAGFNIIAWFKPRLFEVVETRTLDGKMRREPKGRLSFFKRMQFRKGGLVSDHEDVLIGIKYPENSGV